MKLKGYSSMCLKETTTTSVFPTSGARIALETSRIRNAILLRVTDYVI